MQWHQLLLGFVLPLHSVTDRMQHIFDDSAFTSFYFLWSTNKQTGKHSRGLEEFLQLTGFRKFLFGVILCDKIILQYKS
jgi:hypothetical protein